MKADIYIGKPTSEKVSEFIGDALLFLLITCLCGIFGYGVVVIVRDVARLLGV